MECPLGPIRVSSECHLSVPSNIEAQVFVEIYRSLLRRRLIGPPLDQPNSFQKDAMKESKVTVKIPRPLYRKIQVLIGDSGFNSATDFIVFVLRDLVGRTETSDGDFSSEEIKEVKKKLKNLGYL